MIVRRNIVTLELPWPPSVNKYWRNIGPRTIISRPGREYRDAVSLVVLQSGVRRNLVGELAVSIDAYPPDNRIRDLDNLLKAPLDALGRCGIYEDDSQISRLWIERRKVSKPGRLEVFISEVER